MTDAETKSKTGETGTSNAYESFLKIPVDGTIKEVTIDALTRTLKNQGISAEADVLKSIRTKAELQIAHKQKDILDTKDSGNHAPTINRLVKLDQDVIDALTELIAEVDKHIKAKEANTRIEKLKAELLEEAQELKEQLGNEFNFQQFVNELANGLNITHNAPNSNTSGEAINGNPQTTLVSPTSSTYSDTQTHALNQTPPTLEEKIETGIHKQDTLDGWISLIDRASTVVDLKTIVRSLMNKNYSKSGDDFTRLDKAPTGQGRFENQVWERWKQKVKSLGGREGEKNEYDFLLDRYTRIIRLYDFDIPYGNSRTRATNYTTGGAKEAITADEVAKTFSHQDLYYFLIPEDKIYVTEDGVKSPRYPGKIDLHFEHSKEIKELLWFMCLLDSELPDPSEDGLETSKRRGRYFGYNYTAHANSKVEMKREMKEYAKDSFIIGDDADVEELVEIAFSISTVLCIGMKKAILCRMAAISPRENEEAMYKELIKQISPEAAAFYSCQKHEKPLPEYASYAKFSERVLGDMHRGVGLNGKSRHEETEIYLHNLFASLENTMIFWETYNAPYRKDWVVFDYIEGTRLIRTPFPDLMQLFYFDIEGSFEKYISMSNYFTALEGHVEFHRILTSELRLSKGISADKATEKLIEQFTNLLSTFSKIKNVPVDWKYYGRLVLCFIDKMSFAFTHRNMKGNSPDGLDNPISLIESRRFQERVAEVLNTLTGQLKIQKEVVAMMTHTHAKADFYAGAPLTREIEDGGNVITLEDYWRTRLTDTSPEEVRRQRPVRKVRTSAFKLARAFLTGRQNTVEIVNLLHPDFQKHFFHVEFGSGDNVFKDSEGKDH